MAENKFHGAWAYLQGGLETLQPLIALLPPAVTAERISTLCVITRGILALPIEGEPQPPSPLTASDPGGPGGETPGTGGVFFPFGMEHGSRPEPTAEDIEALINRQNGVAGRNDEDEDS